MLLFYHNRCFRQPIWYKPIKSSFEEAESFPIVFWARQVKEPLSSRWVRRMTRVVLFIKSLLDEVIFLPFLCQLIVGSGIANARHVITSGAPGRIVTRVPIVMETRLKSMICSTEVEETSIFGIKASVMREKVSAQRYLQSKEQFFYYLIHPFWNRWWSLQSDRLLSVQLIHQSHHFLL